MKLYMYILICVPMYVCMCVCVCMYILMYLCMFVLMCSVYLYMYIYIFVFVDIILTNELGLYRHLFLCTSYYNLISWKLQFMICDSPFTIYWLVKRLFWGQIRLIHFWKYLWILFNSVLDNSGILHLCWNFLKKCHPTNVWLKYLWNG